MSTLTDLIAEAHEAHILDKPVAECRCGVEMNLTGHRMREHRAHLATVTAAVVANWLESEETTFALQLAAPRSMEQVRTALAAEARKGADQ